MVFVRASFQWEQVWKTIVSPTDKATNEYWSHESKRVTWVELFNCPAECQGHCFMIMHIFSFVLIILRSLKANNILLIGDVKTQHVNFQKITLEVARLTFHALLVWVSSQQWRLQGTNGIKNPIFDFITHQFTGSIQYGITPNRIASFRTDERVLRTSFLTHRYHFRSLMGLRHWLHILAKQATPL